MNCVFTLSVGFRFIKHISVSELMSVMTGRSVILFFLITAYKLQVNGSKTFHFPHEDGATRFSRHSFKISLLFSMIQSENFSTMGPSRKYSKMIMMKQGFMPRRERFTPISQLLSKNIYSG